LGWIIAGERADDPFYLTLVFPILALFFIAAYIIFNKTQE